MVIQAVRPGRAHRGAVHRDPFMTSPPGPPPPPADVLLVPFQFHDDDPDIGPFTVTETISNETTSASGTESYSPTLPPGGHAGPGWTIYSPSPGPDLDVCLAREPVMDMTYTLESADHTQKLTLAVTAQPVTAGGNDTCNFNLDGASPVERVGSDLQWTDSGGPGFQYIVTTAGGDFTVTASFTLRYTA